MFLFFLLIVSLSTHWAAAAEQGASDGYMRLVQDRLNHPKVPLYIGACTPAPRSELSDFTAIAVAFMGLEGWVIGIDHRYAERRFWVWAENSTQPGQAAGWEWTSGGVWISHQIWPITKQLGRDGLRPVASASVATILELAKGKTCDQEPWPPTPLQ